MANLFLPVLKMSAVGGVVILAVMLVRFILRGAPKIYSYILWSVAAFRLLCPVAFASSLSIFNYVNDAPATPVADTVTAVITEPQSDPTALLSLVWFAGIVVLVIYSIITYYRLKLRLKGAERLYDNVYSAEGLPSPFVMGFFSPVIYIPKGLTEEEREYVLKHERVHIKRCDHIVKLFAFGVLALHWFNPLCWLAFVLMSRDMEMSCDERVLRDGSSIKVYGNALVSMATAARFPSPGPISFGEVGVKRRVKNILSWKKPAIWITVISVLLCIGTVSIFATDAKSEETKPQNGEMTVGIVPDTAELPDTSRVPDTEDTTATGPQTSDTTVTDTTAVDTTAADTTTVDTTAAQTEPETTAEHTTKYTPPQKTEYSVTTTQKQTSPPETTVPETTPPETEREVKPIDKPDMDTEEGKKAIREKRYNVKLP